MTILNFLTLVLGYKHRYFPYACGESPYPLSYLSRPHNPCILGAVLRVECYLHESPQEDPLSTAALLRSYTIDETHPDSVGREEDGTVIRS